MKNYKTSELKNKLNSNGHKIILFGEGNWDPQFTEAGDWFFVNVLIVVLLKTFSGFVEKFNAVVVEIPE